MMELAFLACLSTSPQTCENRSLLYTDISAFTCMMAAQPELAKWADTHPDWKISRWACQPVDHRRASL